MAADPKRDATAEVDQLRREELDEPPRRQDPSANTAKKAPIKESPAQVERDLVEEDRFEATDN